MIDQRRQDRICAIIADILGAPADGITAATTFAELGADSLDRVEIVMAIEAEFGVAVTEDELEALVVVGDIFDFFDRLTSAS